jgi:hypothetical protein
VDLRDGQQPNIDELKNAFKGPIVRKPREDEIRQADLHSSVVPNLWPRKANQGLKTGSRECLAGHKVGRLDNRLEPLDDDPNSGVGQSDAGELSKLAWIEFSN